jgi:hypothetical protein
MSSRTGQVLSAAPQHWHSPRHMSKVANWFFMSSCADQEFLLSALFDCFAALRI